MLPATPTRVSSLTLFIADNATVVAVAIARVGVTCIGFGICKQKHEGRSCGCTQRSHTAEQQCKKVEQASASSGNQCFSGHRSVPRIGLIAFDDSTNGGRAMYRHRVRLAGAHNPGFDQEEFYAVGYRN